MFNQMSLIIAIGLAPLLVLSGLLTTPVTSHSEPEAIPAIVQASWLSQNLKNSNLVVVDVRTSEAYKAGHIPESITLPFADTELWWSTGANETLVMPSREVITKTMGLNGLLADRWVVLVADTRQLPGDVAMATRTAATLRYAGIPIGQVAILDGGLPAWSAAGLPVTVQVGVPRPGTFSPRLDASFIVDREDVRARIGKAASGTVIIDARGKDGFDQMHIKSAVSLPATNAFATGGAWKTPQELTSLFKAAVGDSPVANGEVIVYCRIGMLATVWFYALSSILGLENVKLYDGSLEDWVKYYETVSGKS